MAKDTELDDINLESLSIEDLQAAKKEAELRQKVDDVVSGKAKSEDVFPIETIDRLKDLNPIDLNNTVDPLTTNSMPGDFSPVAAAQTAWDNGGKQLVNWAANHPLEIATVAGGGALAKKYGLPYLDSRIERNKAEAEALRRSGGSPGSLRSAARPQGGGGGGPGSLRSAARPQGRPGGGGGAPITMADIEKARVDSYQQGRVAGTLYTDGQAVIDAKVEKKVREAKLKELTDKEYNKLLKAQAKKDAAEKMAGNQAGRATVGTMAKVAGGSALAGLAGKLAAGAVTGPLGDVATILDYYATDPELNRMAQTVPRPETIYSPNDYAAQGADAEYYTDPLSWEQKISNITPQDSRLLNSIIERRAITGGR